LSKIGLALNDGTVDGNGSNARVLTQLVPKTPALDPALPSIAEAIAVMAGSTLLQATKDAPFVEFFVSASVGITHASHRANTRRTTLRLPTSSIRAKRSGSMPPSKPNNMLPVAQLGINVAFSSFCSQSSS
jgi:hypothetical protein